MVAVCYRRRIARLCDQMILIPNARCREVRYTSEEGRSPCIKVCMRYRCRCKGRKVRGNQKESPRHVFLEQTREGQDLNRIEPRTVDLPQGKERESGDWERGRNRGDAESEKGIALEISSKKTKKAKARQNEYSKFFLCA